MAQEQHHSVDEILAGLPFIEVNKDNFRERLNHGPAVLFLYHGEDTEMNGNPGYNERLAMIFRDLMNNYTRVKFFKWKYNSDGLKLADYSIILNTKITQTPFSGYFNQGKLLLGVVGGPTKNGLAEWYTKTKKNFEEMNGM